MLREVSTTFVVGGVRNVDTNVGLGCIPRSTHPVDRRSPKPPAASSPQKSVWRGSLEQALVGLGKRGLVFSAGIVCCYNNRRTPNEGFVEHEHEQLVTTKRIHETCVVLAGRGSNRPEMASLPSFIARN